MEASRTRGGCGHDYKRSDGGRRQFAIVARFDEFGPTLLYNYQSSRSLLAVKSIRSVQVANKVEDESAIASRAVGRGGAKGVMLRVLLGEEGVSVRPFRHWQLADALLDRCALRAALRELVAHLAPGLASLLRLAGLLRDDAEEP